MINKHFKSLFNCITKCILRQKILAYVKIKITKNGFKSHNSDSEKDSAKEFFSFFIRTFVKINAF